MAEPKKPQDHKPKAEKPKAEKASSGKPQVEQTASGFEVVHRGVKLSIEKASLNDFELLRDIGKMQDATLSEAVQMAAVPSIFTRFFGDEQGAKVLNALRDPSTKRVTIEAASTYLFEVFRALNPES